MNNYCVYCHTSPSGKKYVGISCNPEKRWNKGCGYIKNYRFYRAIQKYGWDSFEHTILASGLTEDAAVQMEMDLIEQWDLTNFSNGYNLRKGGYNASLSCSSRALMSAKRIGNRNCVGRILSPETKARISESLSSFYSTNPNPFKGKHHSPETISALKMRPISASTKEKMRKNHANVSGAKNPSAKAVRQCTLDGSIVAEYDYAKLAADKLGLDLSSIIKCCRGKLKSCGGFRWEYK